MKKLDKIQNLLKTATEEHCFSAYQLVAECGNESFSLSGGKVSYWDKNPVLVTESTYFDIGSVTKVVATASLFALGVDRGEVGLEEFVADRVLELRSTPFHEMTIGDLLAHCAGFKSHLLLDASAKRSLIGWFCRQGKDTLDSAPRARAVYSDLGILLAGIVAERLWGNMGKAFEERVRKPLRLNHVFYGPVEPKQCVATEYSLDEKRLWQGVVFDDNCRLLGGVTGHAGLFASAEGLTPFCREWLAALKGKSSWLSKSVAKKFTTRSELVKDSTWGYGWDTRSRAFSSAGESFSIKSFGHLGYPGCSVWIDPDKDMFAVFFTNRIHPSRVDERIKRIRPLVHDEVAAVFN